MTYNYSTNTNKLLNVIDANNNPQTKLGDFRTSLLHPNQVKNSSTVDYSYDLNGNLIKDLNKDIISYAGSDGISYNHLSLPVVITFKKDGSSDKGTITYTYDAGGAKLRKVIQENNSSVIYNGTSYTTNITATVTYIGGFIYETKSHSNASLSTLNYVNRLLSVDHEEGRIRYKQINNTFQYDYFITDHLNNVKVVLTEETAAQTNYMATMEDGSRSAEILLYNNIPETESAKPVGFDTDGANLKVSKLFNASGTDKRIGPGIIIKVMAGDKFKALVKGWYLAGSTNTATLPGAGAILTNVLSAFTGGFPASGKYSGADVSGSGVLNSSMGDFLTYQDGLNNTSRPKAYLNWMVLDDEQFKLVSGNYGAIQIPTIGAGTAAQLLQTAGGSTIDVKRNGYLYVYVSNESQGSVYFDNIRLEYTRGPLTEETHYYPLGMQMAGISSQALNNTYVVNDFKYQGQEYESSLGSNLLEFEGRQNDPQLERWHVPDPASQFASPYLGMANKWPNSIDPDGRFVQLIIGAVIGGVFNLVANRDKIGNFWEGLKFFGVGAASGALGAGIGSGISASLAGASFGSGFLGTTAASATGFFAGATSGAAAGLASGFTSGLGNGLLNGETFSSSFKSASLSGLIGAASGGIFGGVVGGIQALNNKVDFFTGRTSVNLANGSGAHGLRGVDLNKKINVKYVGKFEKIRVYESAALGSGRYSGGITLPGFGITVGSGAYTNMVNNNTWNLLAHEFGHVLQSKLPYVGFDGFYNIVGAESLASAALNPAGHSVFWTETWANYLSSNYFSKVPWNFNEFPATNINLFNLSKFILYRTNHIPIPAFYP